MIYTEKYYIPNIEEFYIGFEYERLDTSESPTFFKMQFTSKDSYEIVEQEIYQGLIRVKHLDAEDLQEIGFKNDAEMRLTRDDIPEATYPAEFTWILGNLVLLQCYMFKGNSPYIYLYSADRRDGMPFTVKNKSELLDILIKIYN